MRQFKTALDITDGPDRFKQTFRKAQNYTGDSPDAHILNRLVSKFDRNDMRRYYKSNDFHGAMCHLYQDNEFAVRVSQNMDETMHLPSIGYLLSPVRRIVNYCTDITAHSNNSSETIKIPKNNIGLEQFMVIDLSTLQDGRIRFDLSPENEQSFLQDNLNKYVHQSDTINNFYMPPNKAVRKEYRDKIDSLIKRVTLMSFLKDDGDTVLVPEAINDLYLREWRHLYTDSGDVYQEVFEYISNNYDGQRLLKKVVAPGHCDYAGGIDLVKAMIKYYTQHRESRQVDYFTCEAHRSWLT